MRHADFVAAYTAGTIRVNIDRPAAARFVSGRLLLPLVMLPILGIGTAIALSGHPYIGLAIIGIATLAPIAIKRSAPHFVITQALQDAKFFDDAFASGLLQIEEPPQAG